jgi:integrase
VGYAAPALDILKKYNYVLPVFQSQKFNEIIKKAAEAAGITSEVKITKFVGKKPIFIVGPKFEFVSSHTARRTCLSILLNDYNLPISHVQDISGHSDLKTLQKYISSDNRARRKQ